jgi:hypothetical protein
MAMLFLAKSNGIDVWKWLVMRNGLFLEMMMLYITVASFYNQLSDFNQVDVVRFSTYKIDALGHMLTSEQFTHPSIENTDFKKRKVVPH